MVMMFRVLGRVITGLGILLVVLGWAAWTWFTGRPWRHHYRGRRYVTRPVRAVAQSGLTAVVLGFVLAPLWTAATLAALAAALGTAAYVSRRRLRRRQAVTVIVGEPIPARVRVSPLRELERAA